MRSVPAATASIELRIHDNGTIECNWGTIAHGDPRPDLNQVGHLMLATATYVQELIDGGPQLHHGAQHSVTRDAGRTFANIEYRGQRWTWELFDAHWWDGAGRLTSSPIMVGRWPD